MSTKIKSFNIMERPKCGICSKVFSNRRALSGHTRTHLATLPLPLKKEPQISTSSSSFCNSSSSSLEQRESDQEEKEKDQKGLVCGLRNKPKKAVKLGVQDRGSDTEAETTKESPTRKRSKRSKKMVLALQAEVSTSVSYTSPEEDVAMCLVMLSRDVWTGPDDSVKLQKPGKALGRKYQCETCKKAFKSFQALGGHRTGHNKINNCFFQENHEGKKKVKLHECPFCHKVFRSGQALGGHKRSHITNSSSTITTPSSSVKIGGSLVNSSKSVDHLLIDLNLPAPMEEDDEDDFSAVSDAEFTNPINAFTTS